jgi:hypothetical protein
MIFEGIHEADDAFLGPGVIGARAVVMSDLPAHGFRDRQT